ncbi:MAG: Fic family protein [Acetobacteraceae bacterium]|nr:Fic family protein [Acetobacteraceae bacterium]
MAIRPGQNIAAHDSHQGADQPMETNIPPAYSRITPLPSGYSEREAVAVDALGDVWRDKIEELKDSKSLQRFNDQLYRRWAIETGILERLYSIDRCVTQVLVERGLDVSFIEHGSTDRPAEEVIAILRDHREAVQYVMDFVAGKFDLSLHFIRSIHQLLTNHQHSVDAVDQFGNAVKLPLIKGDWKKLPNNPTRPDGTLHLYCPPELVQDEMDGLIDYYNDAARLSCPVAILSAWLHHRFTQIHPFQDGNGRVAQALAAFVFVKHRLFPIVVEREDRSDYIGCLESADDGNLTPLVQLWSKLQRKSIESALSLSESLLEEEAPVRENLLRSRLLNAIRDQAGKRREAMEARQAEVLMTGRQIYRDLIMPAVDDLREDLNQILTEIDSSYQCFADHWTDDKGHWFRPPLVEIANKYGYFCDLATYHQWSRLKIRHREGADDQKIEIVISLHGLGRTFSGVLTLSGYVADRDRDEDGRGVTGTPRPIADRPLSFTYAEAAENVRQRCQDWLDMGLNVALESFRKTL